MSEYIGSRISLISKSDIKYIGTLHEIDSESHTVALEKVTSYGTEGRKGNAAEEIAASELIYDFIVFRGSDVKELTIVAPPDAKENQAPPKMPDDPAILGSARPTPQNPQQQQHHLSQQQHHPHQYQQQSQQPPPHQQAPPNQGPFGGPRPPYPQHPPQFGYQGPPPNSFGNPPRFQGPGGPHGFPGTPGAVPGYSMGFPPPPPGYYGPPPGHGYPMHPPPPNFPPNQHHFPQQPPPINSQQGTPHPVGSGGPTPAQVTPPAPPKPNEMEGSTPAPAPSSTSAPPPPVDSKPKVAAANVPAAAAAPTTAPRQAPKQNSRVAVPLPSTNGTGKTSQRSTAPTHIAPAAAPSDQPQSIADATQAATAAVAAAMAKLGPANQEQSQNVGADGLTQRMGQMRIHDQQRGRGRGRGGLPRGGRRESGPRQVVEVPKEDYDFESANAKFNKEDLVKEAIASGSPITSPPNGAASTLTPNDEANGDKKVSEDFVIPAKSTAEKGYDKKSSFFDNISSDLKDRIQQAENDANFVDGRALRREERSKNVETFGEGSVDSGGYRGGFRGRGRGGRGYNSHNRGSGPRGGRGGFESRGGGYEARGGGYRGRGGAGSVEATFA